MNVVRAAVLVGASFVLFAGAARADAEVSAAGTSDAAVEALAVDAPRCDDGLDAASLRAALDLELPEALRLRADAGTGPQGTLAVRFDVCPQPAVASVVLSGPRHAPVRIEVALRDVPRGDRARTLVLAAEPAIASWMLAVTPPPAMPEPSPTSSGPPAVVQEPPSASPEPAASPEPSPWGFGLGFHTTLTLAQASAHFGPSLFATWTLDRLRLRFLALGSFAFASTALGDVSTYHVGAEASASYVHDFGAVRLALGVAVRAGALWAEAEANMGAVATRAADAVVLASLPIALELPLGGITLGVEVAPGAAPLGTRITSGGVSAVELRSAFVHGAVYAAF